MQGQCKVFVGYNLVSKGLATCRHPFSSEIQHMQSDNQSPMPSERVGFCHFCQWKAWSKEGTLNPKNIIFAATAKLLAALIVFVGQGMSAQNQDWAAVAAVGMHTVALKTDGTVWAWGARKNSDGIGGE